MTKITNTRGIAKCVAVIAIMAFAMVALCACGPKEITVTVLDEGKSTEVGAHAGETVGDILSAAGIAVNEGDEVSPSLDSEIKDEGEVITIERMKKVVIAVDGKNIDVELLRGTVRDALEEAGVTLAEGDEVSPSLDTEITGEGLTVTVERVKSIVVAVDGENIEVAMVAGTVQDALDKAGVTLAEGDEVSPSLDSEIGDGDVTITVERMKHVVVAVDGENIDVAMVNGTVQDALDSAGVTLKDGDKVDVDTAAPLEDGMLITVTRYVKKPEPAASNNTSSRNSGSSSNKSSEKSIVSRTQVPNCSGDGHGYYEITWSDGSMTYEEY